MHPAPLRVQTSWPTPKGGTIQATAGRPAAIESAFFAGVLGPPHAPGPSKGADKSGDPKEGTIQATAGRPAAPESAFFAGVLGPPHAPGPSKGADKLADPQARYHPGNSGSSSSGRATAGRPAAPELAFLAGELGPLHAPGPSKGADKSGDPKEGTIQATAGRPAAPELAFLAGVLGPPHAPDASKGADMSGDTKDGTIQATAGRPAAPELAFLAGVLSPPHAPGASKGADKLGDPQGRVQTSWATPKDGTIQATAGRPAAVELAFLAGVLGPPHAPGASKGADKLGDPQGRYHPGNSGSSSSA
nr:collagen alpha-1(I) chain-like [Dermacentor andersoni]